MRDQVGPGADVEGPVERGAQGLLLVVVDPERGVQRGLGLERGAAVGLPTPDGTLTATTTVGKVAVGYAPGDETWTFGAAVRIGRLDVDGAEPLFALVGSER